MQGEPFIPEKITVHLGYPKSDAENVTVSFPDYVKNVASSEIYPTWPENSIRANVYVIISYALNRIYTEYYRSQGYDFDITNSIQYDMSYVPGRDIFQPISRVVDEIFNSYISRQGNIEPLFAVFCDGKEVQCNGLSQWGSVTLANQGYIPYNILTYYYGDDIDIISDAPVQANDPSYPGIPINLGMSGGNVSLIQTRLNRISANYPAIPKIYPVDGIFGVSTENAVKEFQRIWNLPQNGVVDKATWYKIIYIYTSIKRLSELNSEGLALSDISSKFPEVLRVGDSNDYVRVFQYYLAVIGAYYERVPPVDITGNFGTMTEDSVKAFQKLFGLEPTGIVDEDTWNEIYRAYAGIIESVPAPSPENNIALYPNIVLSEGITNEYVRILQQYLSYIHKTYPQVSDVNPTGYFGPMTKSSVISFQNQFGLNPTGVVSAITWDEIASVYSDLKFGYDKNPEQNPGYTIK
ncbi:MAG: spore cortex-lytic protein [Ruminococcus sp.]|nr:spore cortex-lytic protein [Ruminococcus sp.]